MYVNTQKGCGFALSFCSRSLGIVVKWTSVFYVSLSIYSMQTTCIKTENGIFSIAKLNYWLQGRYQPIKQIISQNRTDWKWLKHWYSIKFLILIQLYTWKLSIKQNRLRALASALFLHRYFVFPFCEIGFEFG